MSTCGVWAKLNEEGMKSFGEIFPDGIIPIVNPVPHKAMVAGSSQDVYLVNFYAMEKDVVDKLLETLAKKFRVNIVEMSSRIRRDGLPVRASLVSSTGVDMRLLT